MAKELKQEDLDAMVMEELGGDEKKKGGMRSVIDRLVGAVKGKPGEKITGEGE